MDSVEIRGLYCRCIIGIRTRERRLRQPVRIDVSLALDLERAGKSGRIAHTVDYARAASELIALLQFRCYWLLEVAAEECAGWLFAAHPAIQAVSLHLTKPQALAGQAESGGVRVTRKRPPEVVRRPTDFGFVQPQLETSDASISLVGLAPGASVALEALGAKNALVLPLSSRLESGQLLHPHAPVRLPGALACSNRDAQPGSFVICAQRVTQAECRA